MTDVLLKSSGSRPSAHPLIVRSVALLRGSLVRAEYISTTTANKLCCDRGIASRVFHRTVAQQLARHGRASPLNTHWSRNTGTEDTRETQRPSNLANKRHQDATNSKRRRRGAQTSHHVAQATAPRTNNANSTRRRPRRHEDQVCAKGHGGMQHTHTHTHPR